MNSRELRSLEEVAGKLLANCFPLKSIRADDDKGQFFAVRREHVSNLAEALSSRTEGPAPTSSPKGLERWREILIECYEAAGDEISAFYLRQGDWKADDEVALSAIRRSVEEALGAAASPLEVTDEMVECGIAAWINWETKDREAGLHGYMRAAIEAALSSSDAKRGQP